MGGMCTREKPSRFLLQGLDAAGKTSLLYKLKLGEIVTTIPTIGFNVESIYHQGVEFEAWDLGGRDKIRPLFRHYYPNTQGLIYVLDSQDVERLEQAFEELDRIFSEELLQDVVVMVLANKQDLEGAVGPDVVETRLKESCKIGDNSTVFVMPCSVITGEGLDVAFSRLVHHVKLKKEGKLPGGLIPRAWEEAANQEAGNKGADDHAGGDSFGVIHRMKKSVLKDPFNMLKSLLFY